jgi:hypothetical protein
MPGVQTARQASVQHGTWQYDLVFQDWCNRLATTHVRVLPLQVFYDDSAIIRKFFNSNDQQFSFICIAM